MPDSPLAFIQECVSSGRLRWTYHVTMRLKHRALPAKMLSDAVATLEIIESYPHDKYLPSFLVRGEVQGITFHAQLATDVEGSNVRVITMYIPDTDEWDWELRSRRKHL